MDKASRNTSQPIRKASDLEEDRGTSSATESSGTKPAPSSSSARKPRSKQTPLPALQQRIDVRRPSVKPPATEPAVIKAVSESILENTLDYLEDFEPTIATGSAVRSFKSGDKSPASEYISRASYHDAEVEARLLPDSFELEDMWEQISPVGVRCLEHQKLTDRAKASLDINSLLLSVNRIRNDLSDQVKQICESGIALYEYGPSSLMPASVADAEEYRDRWNELQSVTTVYVNDLLEFEDGIRALAVRQNMLDHPDKQKHGNSIADRHPRSEKGTDATSMTNPPIRQVKLTAAGEKAHRALQNDIDHRQNRIEELFRENVGLTDGLEGADLEDLDLNNDQKEQINDNYSAIEDLETEKRSLQLRQYQLGITESVAAVRAAA